VLFLQSTDDVKSQKGFKFPLYKPFEVVRESQGQTIKPLPHAKKDSGKDGRKRREVINYHLQKIPKKGK